MEMSEAPLVNHFGLNSQRPENECLRRASLLDLSASVFWSSGVI